MYWILSVIREYPFCLLIISLVIVSGLLTQSHRGPLGDHRLHDFGFAPIHLPHRKWHRLVTSAVLTEGGTAFYAAIVMLALCVGGAEKRYGSGPTTVIFWSVHFVTLISSSLLLILPLHHLELYPGALLANAHDVGPSAGYYGCLGAICHLLSAKLRFLVGAALALILAGRLIGSMMVIPNHGRTVSAHLAHAIACPLGWLIAICLH